MAEVTKNESPIAETFVHHLHLEGDNDGVEFDHGGVFFVGTATVILQYAGLTILTDPNFLHQGDHVHLGPGVVGTRLTEPALKLDELREIDFIVLSHFHEDHFDKKVQKELSRSIPIISTPHAVNHLTDLGFITLFPLEKWEKALVTKGALRLTITSMPGNHAPTGTGLGFVLPPVMGTMLEFHVDRGLLRSSNDNINVVRTAKSDPAKSFTIYISGDTLMYDEIKEIPKFFSNIDLLLVHLGGTTVFNLFVVTMDAKQGLEFVQTVKPKEVIPIHYNDYDVFKSSLEDFLGECKAAEIESKDGIKIVVLKHGDSYKFQIPPERLEWSKRREE